MIIQPIAICYSVDGSVSSVRCAQLGLCCEIDGVLYEDTDKEQEVIHFASLSDIKIKQILRCTVKEVFVNTGEPLPESLQCIFDYTYYPLMGDSMSVGSFLEIIGLAALPRVLANGTVLNEQLCTLISNRYTSEVADYYIDLRQPACLLNYKGELLRVKGTLLDTLEAMKYRIQPVYIDKDTLKKLPHDCAVQDESWLPLSEMMRYSICMLTEFYAINEGKALPLASVNNPSISLQGLNRYACPEFYRNLAGMQDTLNMLGVSRNMSIVDSMTLGHRFITGTPTASIAMVNAEDIPEMTVPSQVRAVVYNNASQEHKGVLRLRMPRELDAVYISSYNSAPILYGLQRARVCILSASRFNGSLSLPLEIKGTTVYPRSHFILEMLDGDAKLIAQGAVLDLYSRLYDAYYTECVLYSELYSSVKIGVGHMLHLILAVDNKVDVVLQPMRIHANKALNPKRAIINARFAYKEARHKQECSLTIPFNIAQLRLICDNWDYITNTEQKGILRIARVSELFLVTTCTQNTMICPAKKKGSIETLHLALTEIHIPRGCSDTLQSTTVLNVDIGILNICIKPLAVNVDAYSLHLQKHRKAVKHVIYCYGDVDAIVLHTVTCSDVISGALGGVDWLQYYKLDIEVHIKKGTLDKVLKQTEAVYDNKSTNDIEHTAWNMSMASVHKPYTQKRTSITRLPYNQIKQDYMNLVKSLLVEDL